MNPIEQIWTEIRKRGFKNVIFKSLDAVIDKLAMLSILWNTVQFLKSLPETGCFLLLEKVMMLNGN